MGEVAGVRARLAIGGAGRVASGAPIVRLIIRLIIIAIRAVAIGACRGEPGVVGE